MLRLFFILIATLFSATLANADESGDYGYNIPNTPLYVGGYLSAVYDKEEIDDLLFDDISLLFYANRDKYHLLGEIEASELPLRGGKNSDIRIYIERLQLNYDIDDVSTLTVGKFNSDIGFWNLAPVNTLTDTTTAPYLMKMTFPELTTGLMYSHSFAQEQQLLSVTIQHNPDMDRQYNNIVLDRHYGIGFSYYGSTYTWRINGGYYHERNNSHATYAGIGYQRDSFLWTIQGEIFTKQANRQQDIPYDGYMQFTRHLNYRHDIVFRQEFYKDDAAEIQEGISLIGYTYRPKPSIALKGEYIRHTKLPANRFVFSCSMVF